MEAILDLQIVPPGNGKQHCLARTKKSGGKDQCSRVVAERKQEKAWYLLRECMSCTDLDDQAVGCHTEELCELLIHSVHQEERESKMKEWSWRILEFRNDPNNRNACRNPPHPLDQAPRALQSDHIPLYVIGDPVESEEIMISSPDIEIREDVSAERYRSIEADQSGNVSTNESIEEISTSNTSRSHAPHQLSETSTVYSPNPLSSCLFGLLMHFGTICGLRVQIGKSHSSQKSANGSMVYLKLELGILAKFLPLLLVGIVQVSLLALRAYA
ncbi:hypothetical protein N7508_007265 [Penicillium antarcticum]|nr:uncharacterized protein N7508_007265 [Penicillium antarcticum]KAJ5302402.1 hypothetical protein N7508_007265 [Penicillium antarcticum]